MARTPAQATLKMRIRDHLMDVLYSKTVNVLYRKLDEIIIRDAGIRGDGVRGFTYKGENFWMRSENLHIPMFPRLTKNSRPLVEEWLEERNALENEKDKVNFFIIYILNSSDNPLEYLTKFPSGLRQSLSKLYEVVGIPVEGLSFSEVKPPEYLAESYELMCFRVTANLLLE